MAFCSSCGVQLADNAGFCASCGKPVAQAGPTGTAAAPAAAPTSGATTSGLQDNIAGLLAYLVIPAVIFLVIEPYNRNRFVRFHSFQGLFLFGAFFILNIVIGMVPLLNLFLLPLLGLAELIVAIVCMVKAFQNQEFKLPVIGDLAMKQV